MPAKTTTVSRKLIEKEGLKFAALEARAKKKGKIDGEKWEYLGRMKNLLQLLTKRTHVGEAIAAPKRDAQTYALLSEQILRAGGELRSIAI